MVTFNLVGCGRIAQRHSQLLAEGQVPGASLGAVCDSQPDRAKSVGERFGVPWYASMHDMMSAQPCDVVSVLSESGLHAQHCLDLVGYGSHILVEKPMALTLKDADRMIAACDQANLRLFVVKQNRFNRPVVALRRALESGRLGKLTMGTVRVRWCRTQQYYDQDPWRGTWALDGGVLANQASHHIDLLEWMMGDVDTVYATTRRSLVDIEAEDTAVGVLQFSSGAVGIIEATTATRPTDLEGSLSLLGDRGTVEIAGFAVNEMRTWNFVEPDQADAELAEMSENPPDVYGFGHRAYLRHVVESLETGAAQLVDGLEGRRSLELIQALYESAASGQPVDLRLKQRASLLGRTSGTPGGDAHAGASA